MTPTIAFKCEEICSVEELVKKATEAFEKVSICHETRSAKLLTWDKMFSK
jgi:hypothetical protein